MYIKQNAATVLALWTALFLAWQASALNARGNRMANSSAGSSSQENNPSTGLATCTDSLWLREAASFLTGSAFDKEQTDPPDLEFWSKTPVRTRFLPHWTRRREQVQNRGFGLSHPLALGTLLYGIPEWQVNLAEAPATGFCGGLRPLIVQAFSRPPHLLPLVAGNGDDEESLIHLVHLVDSEGALQPWSPHLGAQPLVTPWSDVGRRLGRLLEARQVGSTHWKRWEKKIENMVADSGCLPGRDGARKALLQAIVQAQDPSQTLEDLANLRSILAEPPTLKSDPTRGAELAIGPPAIEVARPLAWPQGRTLQASVDITVPDHNLSTPKNNDNSTRASGMTMGGPVLVRVLAFDSQAALGSQAVMHVHSHAVLAPGPSPTRLHIGHLPTKDYCLAVRAYSLATGMPSSLILREIQASETNTGVLSFNVDWTRVGVLAHARLHLSSAQVHRVGFSVVPTDALSGEQYIGSTPRKSATGPETGTTKGGRPNEIVWDTSPPFSASLPVPQDRYTWTIRAVAEDANGTFLLEDQRTLSVLPKATRLALRRLPSRNQPTSTIWVAADLKVAPGLATNVANMEFKLDGQQILSQDAPPFLVQVPPDTQGKLRILQASATLTNGDRIDNVLQLGNQATVTEQLDVVVAQIAFSVRGRNQKAPLTAQEIVVKFGEASSRASQSNIAETGSNGPSNSGLSRTPDNLLFAESLPLRVQVVVDASSTMLEERHVLARSLQRFSTQLLKPGDQVGLLAFQENVQQLLPMPASPERFSQALAAVSTGGGTAVFDAVASAITLTTAGIGRRAVLLISDGLEEHSALSSTYVEGLLRASNTALYFVHLDTTNTIEFSARATARRRRELRGIAQIRARFEGYTKSSGGQYCFATSTGAVDRCLDTFVKDLRTTYLATIHLSASEALRYGHNGVGIELRPGVHGKLRIR